MKKEYISPSIEVFNLPELNEEVLYKGSQAGTGTDQGFADEYDFDEEFEDEGGFNWDDYASKDTIW